VVVVEGAALGQVLERVAEAAEVPAAEEAGLVRLLGRAVLPEPVGLYGMRERNPAAVAVVAEALELEALEPVQLAEAEQEPEAVAELALVVVARVQGQVAAVPEPLGLEAVVARGPQRANGKPRRRCCVAEVPGQA
jgi:hypothetical protein